GDIYFQSGKLTALDSIDGGDDATLHLTGVAKLTDAYFGSLIGHVENVKFLELGGVGKGLTFIADSNFSDFAFAAGTETVKVTNASGTYDFTNFTAEGPVPIDFWGGNGNNIFIGGPSNIQLIGGDGNDSFRFSAADFVGQQHFVWGGPSGFAGKDEIVILDA